MQVNNTGKVSFGTQVKISSDDMLKMQKVDNPYFSRIMSDIKTLQNDENTKDILEIKNVSVGDRREQTGFIADLVLKNEDHIEFLSTLDQVNVNGMDANRNKGRMMNVYLDLKQKLTDILDVATKML